MDSNGRTQGIWRLSSDGTRVVSDERDGGILHIATVNRGVISATADANAEHIVAACNAHDALQARAEAAEARVKRLREHIEDLAELAQYGDADGRGYDNAWLCCRIEDIRKVAQGALRDDA